MIIHSTWTQIKTITVYKVQIRSKTSTRLPALMVDGPHEVHPHQQQGPEVHSPPAIWEGTRGSYPLGGNSPADGRCLVVLTFLWKCLVIYYLLFQPMSSSDDMIRYYTFLFSFSITIRLVKCGESQADII